MKKISLLICVILLSLLSSCQPSTQYTQCVIENGTTILESKGDTVIRQAFIQKVAYGSDQQTQMYQINLSEKLPEFTFQFFKENDHLISLLEVDYTKEDLAKLVEHGYLSKDQNGMIPKEISLNQSKESYAECTSIKEFFTVDASWQKIEPKLIKNEDRAVCSISHISNDLATIEATITMMGDKTIDRINHFVLESKMVAHNKNTLETLLTEMKSIETLFSKIDELNFEYVVESLTVNYKISADITSKTWEVLKQLGYIQHEYISLNDTLLKLSENGVLCQ